jgi:hypothetical protein
MSHSTSYRGTIANPNPNMNTGTRQILIICDRGMIFLKTLLTRSHSIVALTKQQYPKNMPQFRTETYYVYNFT